MSWLESAWFIARKDVQYLLRQKATILWTFVMPVVFFFFIGNITGGFGGGDGEPDKLAVLSGEETGFLGDELARRLEEQNFELVPVESAAEMASYRRRLTVPERLTAKALAGEEATVDLVHEEEDLGSDYDEVRVGRALYTVLADLVVTAEAGETPSAESIALLRDTPRALTLEVMPAGERQNPPVGFEQAIPGTLVMFTLLVLLSSGAVLLVIERQQGLLRRLASTPISRGSVVLGKWGGRMALGLVQIGFGMFAGTLLFGMNWGDSLPAVLVVLVAYASLAASLGILLGTVARTEGQAVGLGVMLAIVLAALGGCWWPIEITPSWMRTFSRFLPTGLTMDALHKLVSFGAPGTSVIPHVVILLLAAILGGWIAARSFRFQ
jgi:ABC-type Na+ efflux pump permease subunit